METNKKLQDLKEAYNKGRYSLAEFAENCYLAGNDDASAEFSGEILRLRNKLDTYEALVRYLKNQKGTLTDALSKTLDELVLILDSAGSFAIRDREKRQEIINNYSTVLAAKEALESTK